MPRTTSISPERLQGWLHGWSELHGGVTVQASEQQVVVVGNDDPAHRLLCQVPFPPMKTRPDLPYGGLLDHARTDRLVGVILVRRGGYAVGVFDGRKLLQSKVGGRYVQGRTKAGGWSQQRYARRRENQARKLYEATAETAARVFEPFRARLEAVVLGGDRQGSTEVIQHERLRVFRPLVVERRLTDVPDPKAAVLARMPDSFRAVLVVDSSTEVPEQDHSG